ncbi:MAG: xanthine dehydrogenase FAD-binding subunit XdhB [Firmicutes bacterium]|nr:xanthine dehydrogenase FAD-binding subunit XdhB [Bacillota bacterium]
MFDFERITLAHSVAEALTALAADPAARVIAGGTDVLIKIREGKYAGCSLVSIHDIPELRGVSLGPDGCIHIGPVTTFAELTASPVVMEHIPVLGRAADTVGGPQIRAMGTVGGNISNGVTSADTATTLLNLEAELTLTSLSGSRTVNVNDYYVGAGRVCLEAGELLTDICIRPENYRGWGGCYLKYAMRNAMDIATLGTSCLVRPGENGTVENIRLAFGVAAPVPMRARKTEAALTGRPIAEALAAVGESVRGEITPRTSWRASKEFRLQIAGENARRALEAAWLEAGGEL